MLHLKNVEKLQPTLLWFCLLAINTYKLIKTD